VVSKILKLKNKNICLISDSYIPQKISAAGMIYNLSRNIADRNINITCAFSGKIDQKIKNNYLCDDITFITTNILSGFRNKSLISRFIFEIATAIVLGFKCYVYFKNKKKLDLIIWYGPSVFLWIVVKAINCSKKVPVYYILRDIFPDWLVSLKVVKNPIIIWLLKIISHPQYIVSDIIGVETYENINYLSKKIDENKKIELLFNWPNLISTKKNTIDDIIKYEFKSYIDQSKETQAIICLYLGNASVAHDYQSIVKFFNNEHELKECHINIFGKRNKLEKLYNKSIQQKAWGLVHEYNLPFILSKVDCGIVSLNRNSKTHNIPGKFVSYTQFGLPIICFANANSSLAKLIFKYDCGIVIDLEHCSKKNWKIFSNFISHLPEKKLYFSKNSFKLFKKNFDTKAVANQILTAFN